MLYYQTELFLIHCDRGAYDPDAVALDENAKKLITKSFGTESLAYDKDPLKSLCLHLLERHETTWVIFQRARAWMFTIARE